MLAIFSRSRCTLASRRSLRTIAPILAVGFALGCQRGDGAAAASLETRPSVLVPRKAHAEADQAPDDADTPQQCVVFLHGKSGHGEPLLRGPVYALVRPNGNADGWGGRQWLYDSEPRYAEVRVIVARAIRDSGCARVILHGFSNGGALAAKFYCRGEDFDGKVLGYVIDDPVVDHVADQCKPRAGKGLRLYWTGALSQAADGWDCKDGDWTCEGGSTIGIDKFAARLGVKPTQSAKTKHAPYDEPPDYARWW